jgi:hypothetical protein
MDIMNVFRTVTVAVIFGMCGAAFAQPVTIFYDDFEEPDNLTHWSFWPDASWVQGTAGCNQPTNCWASDAYLAMDDPNGGHEHHGTGSVRHEEAQPWWAGRIRIATELESHTDKTITVSVWMFEDLNRTYPIYPDHDQIQSWLVLMDADETEFIALGLHAHSDSPGTLSDWWENFTWGTAADGWHPTTFPRSQAWHQLKIVVHPYSGKPGDVEFYVDDVKVGEGSRTPGIDCNGVVINQVGLGANPKYISEDYIANTYERVWYDEVELQVEATGLPCPNPDVRFDSDNDGDVDQDDFAAFQLCLTGPNDPGGLFDCSCKCMKGDADADIDDEDLGAFEDCASGPDVPADVTCDDLLPFP